MKDWMRSRSKRRATAVIASVLMIGGAAVTVAAALAQHHAPQPSAAAAGLLYDPGLSRATSTSVASEVVPFTKPSVSGLQRSLPVTVTIPSIGVHSALVDLGQNADDSVEVPTSFHVAGWYDRSVTPGQTGPSIILGHVDSKAGPGIFFRLGALKPGDLVSVNRTDGSTVVFEITAVRSFSKVQFPTVDVYANTASPTIRLITCGGSFDRATGHYRSNIVAFGQLIAPRTTAQATRRNSPTTESRSAS